MADSTVKGKGSLTVNNTLIYPKDEDLTAAEIKNLIEYHHSNFATKYEKDRNYYIGQHPILTGDEKPLGKPDYRLVVNYPKYMVDTFNGFFIGLPPKIALDDDKDNQKLNQFANRVSLYDKLYEASKQASINGHSYLMAYQNEDSETGIALYSPENAFMVYDDTVEHLPLAFITYSDDDENKRSGVVYKADGQYDLSMQQTDVNIYNMVPAVEILENDERQSIFENVLTLIDAVNTVISQKMNDVDYFADGYLKVLNAGLDEDSLEQIKSNRIINLSNSDPTKDVVVEFMERPNADSEQENLINRLNNWIFEISSVSNITDSVFGNADSGKALEYHLLSMRNLASSKERKMTQALRQLFQIVFSSGSLLDSSKVDEWQNLTFLFSRNLPGNLSDEASVAKQLEGVVSKETQLKVLSVVDDPKTEIEKMNEEAKEQADVAKTSSTLYDFEKNGDKPDDER